MRNPSERYADLIAQYRHMHENGCAGSPAEATFDGRSLTAQADRIKHLIKMYGASSVLDYGCGKAKEYGGGIQHEWGVGHVKLYDPAYAPYSVVPTGKYDCVICTDVLEHCPEDDVEWIVDEIFGFSNMFVFASVACYKARKTLPNGENAHCTIRPVEWWESVLNAAHEKHGVDYHAIMQTIEDGKMVEEYVGIY